jgi:glycerophosphoryl diester phosphodiesterase
MSWEISNNRCLNIAHRGDTKVALENTLPAFESALKLGVDGIELDLQLSRDGHAVVFHDDDLRRLAGRDGTIDQFTLVELRTIRLSDGGQIPTLEELLDLVKDHCLLNLEIKTRPHWYAFGSGQLEAAIARILKIAGLAETILMSSFHPMSLWRMRRLAPQLKRGVLFEKHYALHRMAMPLTSPFSVNAPLSHATEALVKAAHDAKRRFLVWTVNDENDMKRCLETRVDGIITDEPRRLKTLLERPGVGRQ